MLLSSGLKFGGTLFFPKQKRCGYCKDKDGNPIQKRVILIDQRTGLYIGSCTSHHITGYWEYRNIDITIPDECILEIAVDDTGMYEAVARSFKSRIQ